MKISVDKEFKALIPPLTSKEFTQLEANLVADGCRDPLVVWGKGADVVLIDGHNRFEICNRLKIKFEIVEADGIVTRDDAIIWIVDNQLGRRNLADFVKIELGLVKKPIIEARAKANQRKAGGAVPLKSAEPVETNIEIAKAAGTGKDSVRKVEKIKETAAPELLAALRAGDVSINAGADIATLTHEKQAAVIQSGSTATAAKEVRAKKLETRRAERIENIVEISRGNTELKTDKKFPLIYADPPWRYEHVETESRAIENQYPTMTLDEICELPVDGIAAADCVLFMWATSPKLAEAFQVLRAWGFEYRTCAVWDKQKIGMGYYFRQQHELLLVATRGEIPTPLPANRPASVFSFPRGSHSSKPHEVAEMIEAMYPELPKVELFCRSPRDGWEVWGNQAKAA